MKNFSLLFCCVVIFSCAPPKQENVKTYHFDPIPVTYPVTAKVDTVDQYHGQEVKDPYRWLEDDQSDETAAWVEEQNKVTFGYLEKIPFRDKINERLTQIWNYPKITAPFKEGDRYFQFRNDGLQNQNVLYVMDNLEAEPKVFLDPNKFSEDGTTSLSALSISNDGNLCAYGIAKGGSDWSEYMVMEVATGKKLDDHLKWIKFSGIAWKGNGFYYSRYDEPKGGGELSKKNEYHKIYYHTIGTDQSEDQLIHENKDKPLRNFYASVTEDERFLIIYESESTSGNGVHVKDLSQANAPMVQIAEGFDYDYEVVDNIDDQLLVLTNNGAPKKRLVLIDTKDPGNWKDIIPEQEEVLTRVKLAGGKILASYLKDAYSKAYVYDLDGKQTAEMTLPGIGSLGSLNGKKEDPIVYYSFASYTFPSAVYEYDVSTNQSKVLFRSEIDFNPDDYTTQQVFYKSKDGTSIPMFITHKKGLERNGKNPTLLYGYGGFNISITPRFSISNLILLENGGIYAVANLRGGGEYGVDWHKSGTKLQKQNVFDDFISAAEYLIREKYTSTPYLAINGRSNGGLLVGATMTQRPDLFKVAFPAVGVLDMLRFHKFTIGWAWVVDYGSSDNPEEFQYLLGYSPVHNVKATAYPATMVSTADHDDRVVPAHSFKFIATLQEYHNGENPVLIRIETNAGHGAGKSTAKKIEENADMWAFMFYHMQVSPQYE